jgi:hypothetical protein
MNVQKTLTPAFLFLLSAYLSFWYGAILPALVQAKNLNFTHIGIFGALVLVSACIFVYFDFEFGKWFGGILVVLNVIFVSALWLPASILSPIYGLIGSGVAISQGMLMGYFICRHATDFKSHIHFMTIGALVACLHIFIPAALFEGYISLITISVLIILVGLWVILMKMGRIHLSKKADMPATKVPNGRLKYVVFTLAVLLILIEIMFFFWSIVLINDGQSLVSQLTFPLIIILIFILRKYSYVPMSKISDLGWLFFLSITLTVGIGMFYTFSFTPLCVFSVGVSLAFLIKILTKIFLLNGQTKHISYILLIGSILLALSGLYVQNHVEFIQSIGMPDGVIILSARQAVVKELAFLSALCVIFSGILFIKRQTIFRY